MGGIVISDHTELQMRAAVRRLRRFSVAALVALLSLALCFGPDLGRAGGYLAYAQDSAGVARYAPTGDAGSAGAAGSAPAGDSAGSASAADVADADGGQGSGSGSAALISGPAGQQMLTQDDIAADIQQLRAAYADLDASWPSRLPPTTPTSRSPTRTARPTG